MTANRTYSVNEVAAELEQLHGHTIQIAGVLHLEFEGNSLLHFPSGERLPGCECGLWANFDVEPLTRAACTVERFNGRRVVVAATIDKDEHGHMGLWPGGVLIQSIAKYGASEA